MNMRSPTKYELFVIGFQILVVLAQNTTTNYTTTCNGVTQPEVCCPSYLDIPYVAASNESVQSVGSVSFHHLPDEESWYLSVLVNDTGPNTNSDRFRYKRESFLSVPNNAPNTSVCLYQLSPLNATKSSDGSSCAGVLSDECMAFMQDLLANATTPEWRPEGSCPDPFIAGTEMDRLVELCENLTPNEQRYSNSRFVVPNDNCSYPSLPGVDLPDNYQTPARGGSLSFYEDPGYRSGFWDIVPASTYDQFVSQVIPFAVVTSFVEGNQNNAVELVCITPNTTQPGGQAIQDGTPWEESGGAGWTVSGRVAVAVAGLVGSILAM